MSLTRVQLSGESERERDECRPRRLFWNRSDDSCGCEVGSGHESARD